MNINVDLTDQGLLPDQYGKFAPDEYRRGDIPVINFPIKIKNIPDAAKSIALSVIDYDEIPVTGFPWIHWLVANLPLMDIGEGISIKKGDHVTGSNSLHSRLKNTMPEITQSYIGPMPSDQTHNYTLTVYAVDSNLKLKPGFFFNEFRRALSGHILDEAVIELPSRSE